MFKQGSRDHRSPGTDKGNCQKQQQCGLPNGPAGSHRCLRSKNVHCGTDRTGACTSRRYLDSSCLLLKKKKSYWLKYECRITLLQTQSRHLCFMFQKPKNYVESKIVTWSWLCQKLGLFFLYH